MKIQGVIVLKSQVITGVSQPGNQWQKQEVVIQTQETYPKKVCLTCFNQTVNDIALINVGECIEASIAIESREYNGRWYTDVKCYGMGRVQQQQFQQQPMQQQQQQLQQVMNQPLPSANPAPQFRMQPQPVQQPQQQQYQDNFPY